MGMTDPIADMLTRIRNAMGAGQKVVDLPHSRMKAELARVLKREGYIADLVTEGGARKTLRLYLKYIEESEPVIRGLERVSRPGRRVYASAGEVPRVLGGLGITVMSTSSGIMTGKEARRRHVGGEVLCSIW